MRLPISGLHVTFRLPDGHDDLAVLEAAGEPRHIAIKNALDALGRLAQLGHTTQAEPTPNPSPGFFSRSRTSSTDFSGSAAFSSETRYAASFAALAPNAWKSSSPLPLCCKKPNPAPHAESCPLSHERAGTPCLKSKSPSVYPSSRTNSTLWNPPRLMRVSNNAASSTLSNPPIQTCATQQLSSASWRRWLPLSPAQSLESARPAELR